MLDRHKKEDIRITKTYNALMLSMFNSLNIKKFKNITVNDLCEEALISRATFYSHFNDKYHLLEYCLEVLRNDLEESILRNSLRDATFEDTINMQINDNSQIIRNLMEDADNEVTTLIHDFIASLIDIVINNMGGIKNENYTALIDFCAAGVIDMVLRHINNNKANETHCYIYELLEAIIRWDMSQK